MTAGWRRTVPVLFLAALAAACSPPAPGGDRLGEAIAAELERNQGRSIDFGAFAGDAWTRVCFFGPYNEASSEALGFDWHVGEHTGVLHSDGHTVIVFATGQEVVAHVEHSRGQGDFAHLTGSCFARDDARFVLDPAGRTWRSNTTDGGRQ